MTFADFYVGYHLTGNGGLGFMIVRDPDGELAPLPADWLAKKIFPETGCEGECEGRCLECVEERISAAESLGDR